jgi:hypothetical protein
MVVMEPLVDIIVVTQLVPEAEGQGVIVVTVVLPTVAVVAATIIGPHNQQAEERAVVAIDLKAPAPRAGAEEELV